MAAIVSLPRWTVEQYLALDHAGQVRHEYIDGAVYALAGGTQAHSAITINVAAQLHAAVQGGPCRVYSSDLKVRVSPTRYLYPDVSVGCEVDDQRDDADWLTAPRVVVEVLSDSTAVYDRGDKFAYYRQIASLRDYVLVETGCRLVEVHSRDDAGGWRVRHYEGNATVELPSLGVRLALDAIYAGVEVE